MSPTACSSRSIPPSRRGWASGSCSAARSWSPGAGGCGSCAPAPPERNSASAGPVMQPLKASGRDATLRDAASRDGPVFIVDDEPAVLDALRLMLGTFGYGCRTFLSAEEFLAAVPPASPGCVIADVRLPGMSGLDLQKELSRRGHALPMVFITAHGDIRMAVAAVKAGAVDF